MIILWKFKVDRNIASGGSRFHEKISIFVKDRGTIWPFVTLNFVDAAFGSKKVRSKAKILQNFTRISKKILDRRSLIIKNQDFAGKILPQFLETNAASTKCMVTKCRIVSLSLTKLKFFPETTST